MIGCLEGTKGRMEEALRFLSRIPDCMALISLTQEHWRKTHGEREDWRAGFWECWSSLKKQLSSKQLAIGV